MKLSELLKKIPILAMTPRAEQLLKEDSLIETVTLDSRKAREKTLFIASKGLTNHSQDGHHYFEEAFQKGAVAVCVENKELLKSHPHLPLFEVENGRNAVAYLSEEIYGHPASHLALWGVTGTNGKTTVTYLLESILKQSGCRPAVMGTLGYGETRALTYTGYTTPEAETISKVLKNLCHQHFTHVVMEVTSHGLASHRVEALRFKVAGFTNFTIDHLDFHGTLEAYAIAKERLFRELLLEGAVAVLPLGHRLLTDSEWQKGREIITWSLQSERADVYAENLKMGAQGASMVLVVKGKKVPLQTQLIGSFNVENVLCAAAMAYGGGMDLSVIVAALKEAKGPPGRLESIKIPRLAGRQPAVLVDFAHTPDALEKTLSTLSSFTKGRLIVVFGCGGDRDKAKRPLMGRVVSELADRAIVTDDNPRSEEPAAIRSAITVAMQGCEVFEVADREEAIGKAIREASSEDVVLIAGRGAEKQQNYGTYQRPFEDAAVIQKVLETYL